MALFKDNKDRAWKVEITVASVRRVKSLTGVDLLRINEPPEGGQQGSETLLSRLQLDLGLLVDAIWALIEPDATQAGVDEEDFGRSLGGEAIAAAHDAFWTELADFFRQLRRGDQARAIERMVELVNTSVAEAETQVESIDMDEMVRATFGASSTGQPGSSASTPDR